MWNIIQSLWSSLALFLSALFFHGMILRSIRENKPKWFINNHQHHIIRYFIGMYYGVLGLYFIWRGLPGEDFGIYTDMLINIIILLNIFSGTGPATIATSMIIIGKLLLGHDPHMQLIYAFFLLSYHFICIQVNTLKISLVKKFILSKLSITPFMLYYLHFKMAIPLQVYTLPKWLLIFTISFVCSLLLYLAARFIDTSNKQILELRQSSILDPLTKLANYRHFDTCLRNEHKESTFKQTPLSVIIFDIDFFKSINDTYGHQTGNIILSHLSIALKKVLFHENALIARIGGEEFAVLLPDTSRDGATFYAEQLRKQIEKTDFPFKDEEIRLTVSVGAATMDHLHHFESGEALLKAADTALYTAKENGRNRVYTANLIVPLKE